MNKLKSNSFFDAAKMVLSDIETGGAIASAIVIAILSYGLKCFIELCEFIYWSAFFYRLNIPLQYLNDAIIASSGYRCILFLELPALILICIFFSKLDQFIKNKTGVIPNLSLWDHICIELVFGVCFVCGVFFVATWISDLKIYTTTPFFLIAFFYARKWMYQVTIGKRKKIAQRQRIIRISVMGMILLYLILIAIGIIGFEHDTRYSQGNNRALSIIRGIDFPKDEIVTVEDIEEDVLVVLFETDKYYYGIRGQIAEYNAIQDSSTWLNVYSTDYMLLDKNQILVEKVFSNRLRLVGINYPYLEYYNQIIIGYILLVIIFLYVLAFERVYYADTD